VTSHQNIQALHRAVGLENDGFFFEAERLYIQLARQSSGGETAHYQYAKFLLRKGEYQKAWPHFMRRLEMPVYLERTAAFLKAPYWDGRINQIDEMRTILVYADQGIGDALMCARFLSELNARFQRVVFLVFKGYRSLFASLTHEVTILEYGEVLPEFDVHADLFSIPALLNKTLKNITDPVCLKINSRDREPWIRRLSNNRLNVGLAWQGNPLHSRDQERSAQLMDFNPIMQRKCNFYSLQVGEAETQISEIPSPINITVFNEISESINAIEDKMLKTAALISCLDLVITVDTSIAHLAGALGVPAWILISKIPDWRWMMDTDVSPWYPASRLYRAQERYNWYHPIDSMCLDLDQKIRD
jgi:hypothetical protein